ncbi:hypothetical protein [Streptomyces clavifer]|uniref:hypothetical protein n=1 Tax=Streptomyces clavifer TaxID=68188 RepID=UPI0033B9F0B6
MITHGSTRPRISGTGSTGESSQLRARTVLSAGSRTAVLLALVLAAATACGPTSSSGGSKQAKEWKAGDCAGPDTSKSEDGFQALDCDDPEATLKALEVQDGAVFAQSVQCPAGTDEIISVKVSFGGDASTGGIPSKTVCGRNLSGEHPGDAGAGGGRPTRGRRLRGRPGEGDRLRRCEWRREQGPRPDQDGRGMPGCGEQPHRSVPEPGPAVRHDLRLRRLKGPGPGRPTRVHPGAADPCAPPGGSP